MTVVLDIETVPIEGRVTDIDERYLPKVDTRLKDPEKIEVAQKELEADIVKSKSLDPDLGKIIVVSTIDINNKDYVKTFAGDNEDSLLESFWNYMREVNVGFQTITFNGLSFDLPFLFRRSLYNKIDVPCQMVLKRYSYIPHFDTCEALANWGTQKKKSLDFYCQSFRLGGKKSGSGDQVYGMYKNGEWEALTAYCEDDVRCTHALWSEIKDYYPIFTPTKYDRGNRSY